MLRKDVTREMNRTSVDAYLRDGCGRCDKYKTPECKVHKWTGALAKLRSVLQTTDLEETMKWGSPCYTWRGKNVLMVVSMHEYCALSFFKGALLSNDDALLEQPGPNSRNARYLKFRTTLDVTSRRSRIKALIQEAIALQEAGARVPKVAQPEPMPEELDQFLKGNAKVRTAFVALTPGRQRSYILHVGAAKKAETRVARAARCAYKILAGKGFNER